MDVRVELERNLGEVRLRHLVVAEDSSSASQAGLSAAVRLARWTGARVTVVHVRHMSPWTWAGFMSDWIVMGLRTLDSLEEDARSRATRAFAGSGVQWDLQVRAGQPGQEILRAAAELGADLILIGSNSHSTVHNYLVGSTTAYVTAHARVPVVVVRPPAPHRARHPRGDGAGRPALTVLST